MDAHYLGTDDDGYDIYSPGSADALTARGWAYWCDEDGVCHVTGPA